jgi:hypothetical protein
MFIQALQAFHLHAVNSSVYIQLVARGALKKKEFLTTNSCSDKERKGKGKHE